MGLFNKLVALANLDKSMGVFAALKRPEGYAPSEWRKVLSGLDAGNRDLVDAMNHGGLSSNWEYGGVVEPRIPSAMRLTTTSQNSNSVGLPMPRDEMTAFAYHSHPHVIRSLEGEELPVSLSFADMKAVANHDRGITALDPRGNMAWAIRNQNAPKVPNDVWSDIVDKTRLATGTSSRPEDQNWAVHRIVEAVDPKPSTDDGHLAATLGFSEAMRNRGMFSHVGRGEMVPDEREALYMLAPKIEAATAVAEDSIARWLKSRGYTDGVVRGIIASLAASGGLMEAYRSIEQEAV